MEVLSVHSIKDLFLILAIRTKYEAFMRVMNEWDLTIKKALTTDALHQAGHETSNMIITGAHKKTGQPCRQAAGLISLELSLNTERGAAALFRMLDAFIPGSPYMYGELEHKTKASNTKLKKHKAKLEIALAGRAMVTAGDTTAMVRAGKLCVELQGIVKSLTKTVGYLHAYKRPHLIKVALWICFEIIGLAR